MASKFGEVACTPEIKAAQAERGSREIYERYIVKGWGQARYVEDDAALIEQLRMPGYPAKIERAILFTLDALSENCSQHIPVRYSAAEVEKMLASLQVRIAELERCKDG